ncbi:MAG: DMP19 family protein [Corallococcus sp.]|nr:DMP19 family protein [Bacillota bacterium]MCM1533334.1 DMP19 family protein [Corallococcus sp.]
MTKREFQILADERRDEALLECAYEFANEEYSLFDDSYLDAPVVIQNVLGALSLHYEVLNGGFPQFYFNEYNQLGIDFEKVFRAVNLDNVADLYLNAQECFGKIKGTMPDREDLNAFSQWYDGNPLEQFDCEYGALQFEIEDAIVKYIKDNISYFGE